MIKKSAFITVALIILAGIFFIWNKSNNAAKEPIPSPQSYNSPVSSIPRFSATPKASPSNSPQASSTAKPLASEVNLDVPFTIQAPHQKWEDPYGDFCEEASVLMAASYIKGQEIPNPDFADQKMMEIKSFEEGRFGYHKDTTAEETAIILREFYGIEKVTLINDPTVDQIKRALNEKKVIIIPAAGRELGNPNFRAPGPLYHMLVIKGYTKEGNFITNDPGTRKGENFIYSPDVIMNAIHDWNGGDVYNGKKVIIIVG